MQMPTARHAFLLLLRLLRLRCPNCGRGSVLGRRFAVRERCGVCHFRFERSDDYYFQGALFVNYMLCGGIFVTTMFFTIVLSWPTVPWDALTYGAPLGIVVLGVMLYPVSKVIWLTVDVMVRPLTPDELE